MTDTIARLMAFQPYKIVLSKPTKASQYRKITLEKTAAGFRAEKLTTTQAFHESVGDAAGYLCDAMNDFLQLNAWNDEFEFYVLVSKSGKITLKRNKLATKIPRKTTHDREKIRLIDPTKAATLLYHMGITTREGRVLNAMRSKLAQIDRFTMIADETIGDVNSLHIVDTGCGKSYLSFVLYHYFRNIKGLDVRVTGVDIRADVVEKCRNTAALCGFEHMRFVESDIKVFEPNEPVDMVVSLHACDTATDFALNKAVEWKAKYILAAPCCQHELNAQIKSERFAALLKYGLIKERFAALLTDTIRAEILESQGYSVKILEFAELGHTPKNLLIKAVRTNKKPKPLDTTLIDEFQVSLTEINPVPLKK